jgi:3-oxoacyl-[acyl-carrier protein] reductase
LKQRALILGGYGAIGSAITEQLESIGYDALPVGRNNFDLSRRDEVDNFFDRHPPEFPVLVHAAGHNIPKDFDELDINEIEKSISINLLGFLHVVRHCTSFWREIRFGRVVVLSSLYGFLGRKGRLPYVTAKHALNGVVKTLSIELGPSGVLVNSVSPGYVMTPLTYRNNTNEELEKLTKGVPLNRMGTPDEVAKAVGFLCSQDNTYINGHDLVVDGGFSAGGFQ